jgi:hypothetical protein
MLRDCAIVETGHLGQAPDADTAITAISIHEQRMRVEHEPRRRGRSESAKSRRASTRTRCYSAEAWHAST